MAGNLAGPAGDSLTRADGKPPRLTPAKGRCPIVGIGASAGGLEALRVLFEAMPADTGMGFVVVQHLDATHHSLLAELLAKFTALRVVQVENGMSVEPNSVYVIPPNSDMTISDGVLLLKRPSEARGARMPIDRFLVSLAADRQDQAIGLILSGTGSDGSLGLRELKAHGGLVLVQDPQTAQYDGMPRSAISTGHADAVLPLQQMPEVMLRYVRHTRDGHTASVGTNLAPGQDPLAGILALLLAKTGHDFRCYKKGTVVRRIDRRVGITGREHFGRYLDLLREDDEEVRTLSKDLFIGVTSFFRETEAWAAVAERSVPRFLARGLGRREPSLADMAQQALVETFAPASVLVTRRNQVLYVYGDTSDYLSHPPGELTDDLLAMTRSELRLKTRAALHLAAGEGHQAIVRGARVKRGETVLPITITVTPLERPPLVAGLLLVSFHPEPEEARLAPESDLAPGPEAEMVSQLEDELKTTREELQSTIEALETANEELKASNEEVMSMNEELTTVNSQLQHKVVEVEAVNNDLSNLLASTNIATLFLDAERRIKRFTAAITKLMHLIPADLGRPVADIAHKYVDDTLDGDCRRVIEDLRPVEREVMTETGDWYLRRVQPYRTRDNHIEGTVVTFADVTAIKLRDEEHAKLASIVDASEEAIIGMALDGSITSWNPGAEATYGYVAREMLGGSLDPLFLGRTPGEAEHVLQEVRAGRRVGPYQSEGLRKDGSRVQLSVSVAPIRNGDGLVVAACTIARNITERMQAEAALRERIVLQDRFTKVAATVPGVICSYRQGADGNACMPYASPAIEALCGVKPEDVAQDFGPIRNRIHADDVGHVEASIHESARTMTPWRATWRYRHPSKGEIWIEGHSMPAREPDGSILWHGYIQEVTDRMREDAELFVTQQRLRAVMDALPVGVAVSHDALCQTIDGNPALLALFAAQPGENLSASAPNPDAPGRRTRYFSHGQEVRESELPMQRAVAERARVPPRELEVALPDGRRWLAEISGAPILNRHGEVMGGVAVVLDVTERKRAQQALMDADRRKTEFLAMLAHELRNPLAPIRNAAEVLTRQEALPEKVRWATDLIGRQAKQLELLVSDLLDVSRITHGGIELHKRPVALQDALREALQGVAHQINSARHTLKTHLAEAPIIVMSDPLRLSQIFTNLLRNAVDYTPEGGHIWVTLTEEAPDAVVRVRDDGVGIRAENLDGLFDIFSRGSSAQRNALGPDGLGIGLNLAQRLVEQHGGVLTARSEGPGRGSEFVVRLPIYGTAESCTTPAEAAVGATAQVAHRGRRLLIVDDNPDVIESFKVLLETLGHEVMALHEGRGVVAAIRAYRPDLVFLDIGMPDMDGYQVVAAIQAAGLDGRPVVVALSGFGQDSDRETARAAGFDRYLLKPVSPEEIDNLLAGLD